MKNCILIPAILGLFYWNAAAQTADQWVSQGRTDLVNQDLAGANAAFAQAVALSPTNETANALCAATRLLVLPGQPAEGNFLSRIGFPAGGRNIYDWTSKLPTDTNGLVLAPAGVDADEFTSQLRTNILPAVAGAVTNLAAITDTNFTLDLTSNETSIAAVTVDYGDLKLIQAALYGIEYLIYTLNAQNLDAQLTDLRALYTNGILSVGQVLADCPQLLTFATTNDFQAARTAFTNGVEAYMIASDYIRSRPTNEVRLFNYDKVQASGEADFRLTLRNLEDSLAAGPQILSANSNLTVNLAAPFTGSPTWRSLLPRFDGNGVRLGSFPDLTFGGAIYGLTQDKVEGALGHVLSMIPVGAAPDLSVSNTMNLTFTTLTGHYYTLLASTNLLNWQDVEHFTAEGAVTVLSDSPAGSERFYRLRDDTGFLAFSGQVLDGGTYQPIVGAKVFSFGDGATAFTDANGQFYLVTTLTASWGGDELEISASGYQTLDNFYWDNGLFSGITIFLYP